MADQLLPTEYSEGPLDGSPVTLERGQREVIVPAEAYSDAIDASLYEGVYRLVTRWHTVAGSRMRVGVCVLLWAGERRKPRS